jgi:exosome complex RNA-binding protein Rrp4
VYTFWTLEAKPFYIATSASPKAIAPAPINHSRGCSSPINSHARTMVKIALSENGRSHVSKEALSNRRACKNTSLSLEDFSSLLQLNHDSMINLMETVLISFHTAGYL